MIVILLCNDSTHCIGETAGPRQVIVIIKAKVKFNQNHDNRYQVLHHKNLGKIVI